MNAFYNEINPYAAQWLRNLIAAGHIAPGVVDERSIADIAPEELYGFTQWHFFAGIGGWPLALRRAGWPDDRPVATASAPCQPFSAAGAGLGFDDERHLWPACFHHLEQLAPPVVFGEQVASKAVDEWIDLVCADMEAVGYAFGAVPFPSAGVGAPHIRDRLYWVADADGGARRQGRAFDGGRASRGHAQSRTGSGGSSVPGILGNAGNAGNEGLAQRQRFPGVSGGTRGADEGQALERAGVHLGGLADANGGNASAERQQRGGEQRQQPKDGGAGWLEHALHIGRQRGQEAAPRHQHDGAASVRPQGEHGPCIAGAHRLSKHGAGPTNGLWRDADWLLCRDGKWRPVEPGTFPLAHGAPARVGRLRAYGNAINVEAARVFIEAYLAGGRPDLSVGDLL